jgi:hypothetical protein
MRRTACLIITSGFIASEFRLAIAYTGDQPVSKLENRFANLADKPLKSRVHGSAGDELLADFFAIDLGLLQRFH